MVNPDLGQFGVVDSDLIHFLLVNSDLITGHFGLRENKVRVDQGSSGVEVRIDQRQNEINQGPYENKVQIS